MNIIPMITFKSNLLIAITHVLQLIQIFILIRVIMKFITFPLMANNNIITGHTYIPVMLGLNSYLRKVLKYLQGSVYAMNIIPMITFKSNLLIAIMCFYLQRYSY